MQLVVDIWGLYDFAIYPTITSLNETRGQSSFWYICFHPSNPHLIESYSGGNDEKRNVKSGKSVFCVENNWGQFYWIIAAASCSVWEPIIITVSKVSGHMAKRVVTWHRAGYSEWAIVTNMQPYLCSPNSMRAAHCYDTATPHWFFNKVYSRELSLCFMGSINQWKRADLLIFQTTLAVLFRLWDIMQSGSLKLE